MPLCISEKYLWIQILDHNLNSSLAAFPFESAEQFDVTVITVIQYREKNKIKKITLSALYPTKATDTGWVLISFKCTCEDF